MSDFSETAAPEGQEAPADDQGGTGQGTALEQASAAAGRARDAAGRFVASDDSLDQGSDERNVRAAMAEMYARREEAAKAEERRPRLTHEILGEPSKVPDFGQDMSPRKMAEAMAAYREQETAWVADVEAAAQAKADTAPLEQVTGDRGVTPAPNEAQATQEEMARVRQDLETQ